MPNVYQLMLSGVLLALVALFSVVVYTVARHVGEWEG